MGLGFDDPSVLPPFDDDIFGSKDIHPPHSNSSGIDDDWVGVTNEDDTPRQRKPCAPNLFEYEFGDVFDAKIGIEHFFVMMCVRRHTYSHLVIVSASFGLSSVFLSPRLMSSCENLFG